MKQYHLNKKEIMHWVNKAFKRLKLKTIPIRIEKVKTTCMDNNSFFCPERMFIHLWQVLKIIERKKISYTINMSTKEQLIFLIFHEVAHYFQYHYHREWLNKYATEELYFTDTIKHCDKKLERNADKIAMILFKEFAP